MSEKQWIVGEWAYEEWFAATLRSHVEEVLTMKPTALLLAVELPDGEVKMTALPFSLSLVRGMVERCYELLHEPSEEFGGGDDDDDDDVVEEGPDAGAGAKRPH